MIAGILAAAIGLLALAVRGRRQLAWLSVAVAVLTLAVIVAGSTGCGDGSEMTEDRERPEIGNPCRVANHPEVVELTSGLPTRCAFCCPSTHYGRIGTWVETFCDEPDEGPDDEGPDEGGDDER